MITVPTTSSSTPADTSSSSSATSANSVASAALLSANDFLQILVAEFQNQDPTDPTDPTQYATQLVDFADLGQLQSIDQAVTQPSSNGLMQAASAFIGRQVVAAGNQIGVTNGTATSIEYAPVSTDTYTAMVTNSSGQLVSTVSLGNQPGGTVQTFIWQPPSGTVNGTYTVNIVNSDNASLSGLLEQGVVQSVSLDSNNNVWLNLGNLTLSETAVASIAQPN